MEECFQEGGGTCGIKAVAEVLRNRKQAYSVHNQTGKESQAHGGKQSQRHEFYDVLELLNQEHLLEISHSNDRHQSVAPIFDRFRQQISRSPNFPAYVHPKSTLQNLELMPPLIVTTFLSPSSLSTRCL